MDGEGSFSVYIVKNNEFKVGWRIHLFFEITLHVKDQTLLELIKSYFGVALIKLRKNNSVSYTVSSYKDLAKIIEHFEKYPLITKKFADYELWKEVYFLMVNIEHLTIEGLGKIVAKKSSMNRGLSEELKSAFPNNIPVERPLVKNNKITNPNWIAGFTVAEGYFSVQVVKSKTHSIGFQVHLRFQLTQHYRDEQLVRGFSDYFHCGLIYENRDNSDFKVIKFSDLWDKIIPFFWEYPILGVKSKDFKDWCIIASMLKEKKHLTKDGLDQIQKIKAGINTRRKWSRAERMN